MKPRIMLKVLLVVLRKSPLIAHVTLLHLLQMTAMSPYMNLQTELFAAVLRSLLGSKHPPSISSLQELTTRDPGIKGRIWVSKVVVPVPPENGVRDALLSAVNRLAATTDELDPESEMPSMCPVEAEWVGHRVSVDPDAPLSDMSELQKYRELTRACRGPATVLYLHGGAFAFLDPCSYRSTTKLLANLTGGRCYTVRYRLAPQNPFPAALLDVLISYLALLYPPPGAFHSPVGQHHIVFAGDSAGGNLCLALLQTILEFRRQGIKVPWFGIDREVPLPAGVAVNSAWLDMTQSSPSWSANVKFDYLPGTGPRGRAEMVPCGVWPTNPPRSNAYVADALLLHPLVTLTLSKSWAGAPPVFLCVGWELPADENKFLAGKLVRDGVRVVFEEYEAMPHCFSLILRKTPSTRRCLDGWALFINRATSGPDLVESRAVMVKAKMLQEVDLSLDALSPMTEEQVSQATLSAQVSWADRTTALMQAQQQPDKSRKGKKNLVSKRR